MRVDFSIVQHWITPGSRVLDLACGDGTLLQVLHDTRQVSGYGLDIHPDNITACLAKGLNVLEQDVEQGLTNFTNQSFDTVIMTQALQVLNHPERVLLEMLRIGRQCIVTFPNFGHWRCRWHLAVKGCMPVSEFMPYHWYDTPNIHFCTFRDFERLCRDMHIHIDHRQAVDQSHKQHRTQNWWPNLFGEVAIYYLSKP